MEILNELRELRTGLKGKILFCLICLIRLALKKSEEVILNNLPIIKNQKLVSVIKLAVIKDIDDKKKEIERLNEEITESEQWLAHLEKSFSKQELTIEELPKEISYNSPINDFGKYDPKWSYGKKAEFILGYLGTASTAQIADEIKNFEKYKDRKTIVKNLSVTFSTQKNRFIRIDKGDYYEYRLG